MHEKNLMGGGADSGNKQHNQSNESNFPHKYSLHYLRQDKKVMKDKKEYGKGGGGKKDLIDEH